MSDESCIRWTGEEDCPTCGKTPRAWGADVVERIKEWDALLAVACRETGKSQQEIVALVVAERERRPA
jgi:hypothetical protein